MFHSCRRKSNTNLAIGGACDPPMDGGELVQRAPQSDLERQVSVAFVMQLEPLNSDLSALGFHGLRSQVRQTSLAPRDMKTNMQETPTKSSKSHLNPTKS